MSRLMTCGDAPNCTRTDMAMPTIARVNCVKHWEEYTIEDSMKKTMAVSYKYNKLGSADCSDTNLVYLRLMDVYLKY